MSHATLDDWTADRLLRGALSPDDAPPGYGGVATLLAAARTEARTATSTRAEDTIAAMVAARRARAVAVVPRRRVKARVATAASAGLLALSGVTAAGALPTAAQQQVATVLAKVGIDVPRGNGGHGQPRSGSHAPSADNDRGGVGPTTNHGDCVSQVAGSGGTQVSTVARSDCGKPSTAGGPPADATHGAVPPGQVKPDDKPKPDDTPPPTHPPQSNSGGSNANANQGGPNGTSQGNGQGGAGTPSPTGLANGSPRRVPESHPPASPPPPAHQGVTPRGDRH
jgi:hypothetical protein